MRGRGGHSRVDGILCWSAATLLAALGCLCVAAAPAAAGSYDADASPSHTFVMHGDSDGMDGAADVVIGSGVTWVASSGVFNGSQDAMLTRIRTSDWSATTAHWDGPTHRSDSAAAVALAPDGGVYTAGITGNTGTMSELLVIKWTRTGAVQWWRHYNGPADGIDQAFDVAVDGDGNVIVCGGSNGGSSDWVVASWTMSGKRRWVWRWDGSGKAQDEARELLVDKAGCAYVCGTVVRTGNVQTAAVAKLSPKGVTLWRKTYAGPVAAGARAAAIAADPRGGVLVAGTADGGGAAWGAMIVRYSPKGARTDFPLSSSGGSAQTLNDVAVTSTRAVVGVGSRFAPGYAALQVRYTLDGDLTSAITWPAIGTADRWLSVAPDPFGGFVTGGMFGSEVTFGATRRESTLPGAAFWANRWDGPTPGMGVIGRVAARGNIVVAVGMQNSGAATGHDAIALFWVY